MIAKRNADEIDKIDRACRVVRTILGELAELAKPGVRTKDLDEHARRRSEELGAKPAFLGYMGYPASICCSVNEEVVHGIPGDRALRTGDLVSLDFGVLLDGYYGDSAITCLVGTVSDDDARLSRVTRECLMHAVEQVRPGNRIGDIGRVVEEHARAAGFGVVREFVGHGIGTRMHEEPQIPNYRVNRTTPRIEPGNVLAIEPMITAGGEAVKVLEDGWTAVTRDGSRAAHWELVVAATENGPRILGDPAGFDGRAKE
ncbi:MAG: type I methionyl aminopeptidase [Acidobacteria bacterium]|nr:type I methionyl aminopeptidase [Acidobacteriota bacterium]